jgi:PmbA protein
MAADLSDLVQQVIGWASDGEQVEAYAAHSRDADVDVYQGGIETLSTAETDGVGIRVVLPGANGNRQGFAYTGSLDAASLQACLREARDNASFGTPDPFVGLAEPDGIEPTHMDLYRESLASFPTADKIELAMDLERRVRNGDPRIRSLRSAGYGDGLLEVAIASTTGIHREYRRTGVSISAYAIAGTEDDTQTGFGYSVGRAPEDLDVEKAATMAVERSTRLLGSTKPKSQRTTIVLDPYVTSSLLSILGGTLNAESVLKGRSLFADRVGETVAIDGFSFSDQPTNPLAFGASPLRSMRKASPLASCR